MSKHTFDRNKPHLGQGPPPPPPPPPAGFEANSLDGVMDEIKIDGVIPDQAGSYFVIYATLGMGLGIMSPPKSAFRLIASIENLGLLNSINFTTEYNARFPIAEVNTKVFVQLNYISSTTGQEWKLGLYSALVA